MLTFIICIVFVILLSGITGATIGYDMAEQKAKKDWEEKKRRLTKSHNKELQEQEDRLIKKYNKELKAKDKKFKDFEEDTCERNNQLQHQFIDFEKTIDSLGGIIESLEVEKDRETRLKKKYYRKLHPIK